MRASYPFIYLVEDNADDRFIMQQAFAEANFTENVRMFPSSDYFLNFITSVSDPSELPTLFVLDFNMPIINGSELLRKLKQMPLLEPIPVVLYSNGMRSILRETLIASGAMDCFEKGLEYSELCKLAKTLRLIAEGNEVIY